MVWLYAGRCGAYVHTLLTAVNDHLQGILKAEVPFPSQILAPVIFIICMLLLLGYHALYLYLAIRMGICVR